jgi:hypothetical protein
VVIKPDHLIEFRANERPVREPRYKFDHAESARKASESAHAGYIRQANGQARTLIYDTLWNRVLRGLLSGPSHSHRTHLRSSL